MPAPRFRLLLAALLGVSVFTAAVSVSAQAPRIRPPKPAPNVPNDVLPLPPAQFDNALVVGGDDVKAKKVSSRLSVETRINGQGPYQFLVDSGADTSVVGLRIARDLQLPLGNPVILNGMTARSVVDRVKVAELTLGPSTTRNLQLPALREDDLGGAGLIGIDALVQQRLLMDFEKRLIRVEDARKPERIYRDAIVITARRQRGQLILTQVQTNGVRLDAVIDTGTEITIGNLALRDKLLRRGRTKFTTIPVTGVTGVTVNVQLAEVQELHLGPVMLQNVPMAFADVPPFKVFGIADEPALLLGTDILETFRRVSLDFRARKVRFQLRRCGSSGIVINTAPESFARLTPTGQDACLR